MLNNLRSLIARLFGIGSQDAADGSWWEVDFLLVFFIGIGVLGFIAWRSIFSAG